MYYIMGPRKKLISKEIVCFVVKNLIFLQKKKHAQKCQVIYKVRTLTLKDRLLKNDEQWNDECGEKVLRWLKIVVCLVAEEARCHRKRLSNFYAFHRQLKKEDSHKMKTWLLLPKNSMPLLMSLINDTLMAEKMLKAKLANTCGDESCLHNVIKDHQLLGFVALDLSW